MRAHVFILYLAYSLASVVQHELRLLFGPEYIVASNALRILGIGMMFLVGSSSIGVGMIGTGSPELDARIVGIAACFNIPVNYLLIPQFGGGGAAVATSLSFLLILVLRFRL